MCTAIRSKPPCWTSTPWVPAWLHRLRGFRRFLKVGPRSCGAFPARSATTRAPRTRHHRRNVVLQTLNPTHLLGGRMAVRQDLAKAAIGKLADKLGLGVMETAQGILSVVTARQHGQGHPRHLGAARP